MSKAEVTVDVSKVYDLLEGLTGKEVHAVLVSTVRKGAKKLQKRAEENFGNLITKNRRGKGSLTASSRKYGKVATIKVFKETAYPFATVSVVSRQADFRAKFFEKGTKPRYRESTPLLLRRYLKKKGRISKLRDRNRATWATGQIIAGHYFSRAQKETEAQVFSEIRKDAEDIIKRVWRKKQKQSSR